MNLIMFRACIAITVAVPIIFNYCFQLAAASNTESTCVAKIDDGIAIGLNDIGATGMRMCAFYGIPYAKAPVGRLRFEPPQPVHWTGTQNFVEISEVCPQLASFEPDAPVVGDEDCLYLNIFKPLKTFRGKLLPVFFWIHGGSFILGSFDSDLNGFDTIVKQDVIVVAINYRLGPFGFLSIPHLNITGNMGLKDQQMALEWVQRNIQNFAGDPKRITLAGWSAGGSSVTYHMYNERSRALFNQATVMSGTMLNSWAFIRDIEWCWQNYLDNVKLETKDELQAIEYLELVPRLGESLTFAYFGMSHFCFMPTIEPDWAANRFIGAEPVEMLEKSTCNIPLLIGFTEVESGTMYPFVQYYMTNFNFPNVNTTVNDAIERYIDAYIGNRFENEADQKHFLIKLASMADVFYGIRNFMDTIATMSNKPLYGYQFSFDGRFGNFKQKTFSHKFHSNGAVHGDDLGYLFVPFYKHTSRENLDKEIIIGHQMVAMWTDFVKYGNPTPTTNKIVTTKWRPYEASGEIMNINSTLEMMKVGDTEEYHLWDKIYNCLHKWKCNFLEDNPI